MEQKKKNPHFKSWSRPEMIKYKDNLIASEWQNKVEVAHFNPSYMKEPENFNWVISDEYKRLWFKEWPKWFKRTRRVSLKEKQVLDFIKRNEEKVKKEKQDAKESFKRRWAEFLKRLEERAAKKEEERMLIKKKWHEANERRRAMMKQPEMKKKAQKQNGSVMAKFDKSKEEKKTNDTADRQKAWPKIEPENRCVTLTFECPCHKK